MESLGKLTISIASMNWVKALGSMNLEFNLSLVFWMSFIMCTMLKKVYIVFN